MGLPLLNGRNLPLDAEEPKQKWFCVGFIACDALPVEANVNRDFSFFCGDSGHVKLFLKNLIGELLRRQLAGVVRAVQRNSGNH